MFRFYTHWFFYVFRVVEKQSIGLKWDTIKEVFISD